jgi:hypothetical protein
MQKQNLHKQLEHQMKLRLCLVFFEQELQLLEKYYQE